MMKKWSISLLIINMLLLIAGFFIDAVKDVVPLDKLIFFVALIVFLFFIQFIFYAKHMAIGFHANDIKKDDKFPCQIFASDRYCCVQEYHKHLINNNLAKVIPSTSFFNDYKLMCKEDMGEHEKQFGRGARASLEKKEIWIFSYDLSTEVNNDSFQGIAALNVNAGIKYTYFYLSQPINIDDIQDRMSQIRQCVAPAKRDSHIKFIALSNDTNDNQNLNILPGILGSIIFVDHSGKRVRIESYFSMRQDSQDDNPIYFRMPTCMRMAFYDYYLIRVSAGEAV